MRLASPHRAMLIYFMCVFAWPSVALAQNTEGFRITAPPGYEVFAIIDRGKVPVASVGADGTAAVPFDIIDAGKSVQIMIEDCDGKRVLVLVEEGRTDEDCERRDQAGKPRCGCRRALVILWGRDRSIVVNSAGQVTLGPGSVTADGGGSLGVGFLIDADFGMARMADDNSCSEVIDAYSPFGINVACSKDANVSMFSVDAGVTFARFIAVKVGYVQLGEVTLEASGASSTRSANQTGFFGPSRGVTFTGVVRVPLGPIVPFAEAGVWRWSADSGASVRLTEGSQQLSETFSQEDSGVDPVFGAGVEFWFSRFVGLSAGVKSLRLSSDENAEDGGEVDERFTTFFVGVKLGRR